MNADRISCCNQIASCIMMVWGIPQHLYPKKSASQQIPSVSSPTNPCLSHSEPTMLATGNTTPSRCTEAFTQSMVPPTLLSCSTNRISCCAQDFHETRCPSASWTESVGLLHVEQNIKLCAGLAQDKVPKCKACKGAQSSLLPTEHHADLHRPTCRLCCKWRKNAESSLLMQQ